MIIGFKIKMACIISMAIFLIAIDRALKSLALFYETDMQLIDDFFKFSLEENYNIAFSLPVSGIILNIIIGLIILLLILLTINLFKKQNTKFALLILFIIAGAASNLYDRFRYGYVIDYFDLKYFTVFNLADIIITSAILGLILINLIPKKYAI